MDFIRHNRNPLEAGMGDYKFYLFVNKTFSQRLIAVILQGHPFWQN